MLPAEKIIFSNQKQAMGMSIVRREEIPRAVELLRLPAPRPVIVWIGGAGSMLPRYVEPVSKVARSVAQIAQETNAIVVDGATDGGVMAVLGQVYSQGGYKFPLVGVVAEQLVSWANVPRKQGFFLTRKIRLAVKSWLVGYAGLPWHLDPHHTHFFFVLRSYPAIIHRLRFYPMAGRAVFACKMLNIACRPTGPSWLCKVQGGGLMNSPASHPDLICGKLWRLMIRKISLKLS
jgi:hypothetical protein